MMNHSMKPVRGLTLLIAVILSSVVLSVALSLLDITYKQIILTSSAKQSQFAFYSADSAMECALYWDQKMDAFSYTASSYLTSGITCADASGNVQTIFPLAAPNSSSQSGSVRTTVINLPCTGGGTSGQVTISKPSGSGTATIFATGYSSCSSSDPRRIERGVKATYLSNGSSGGGGGGGGGGEILPVSFTATSNYLNHSTGLTTANGMRDGDYASYSSTHGTNSGTNQAVTADLGSAQSIGSVSLGDISSANPDGWGTSYTNGAIIEGSLDNSAYTVLNAGISYTVDGTTVSYPVSGTYRYIRIRKASSYLGLGEFRIYAP